MSALATRPSTIPAPTAASSTHSAFPETLTPLTQNAATTAAMMTGRSTRLAVIFR